LENKPLGIDIVDIPLMRALEKEKYKWLTAAGHVGCADN
jgi:hypothetical protein